MSAVDTYLQAIQKELSRGDDDIKHYGAVVAALTQTRLYPFSNGGR